MTIPLSPLGERFENEAGWIQNLAEKPVGGVAVLFCKAGSSRSHHYHLSDSHDLYVVSGEMRYVERALETHNTRVLAETMCRIVRAGEMIHTGPMVAHSTYFPVDTILISLSSRSRTKAEHEADVVRCEQLPWSDE
jgi:hypothetical protein